MAEHIGFYRRLANQIVDEAQAGPLSRCGRTWGDRLHALENGPVSRAASRGK